LSSRLGRALVDVGAALDELRVRWALVGGLAVSARALPRTTRDIDLAVRVDDDTQAETIVASLRRYGYVPTAVVEQLALGRLSTVRLRRPDSGRLDPFVDLLFCSSAIEDETVAEAEPLEVFRGVVVPVARIASLVSMKLLARDDRRRPQDYDDLRALLASADAAEIARARELTAAIAARGAGRGRSLLEDLERVLASSRE
jgi:hypothetical protein